MDTNICHNKITLKTSKTQSITNARALIYFRLHDSVAERIKLEAFSMLTYCKKSSNPAGGKFFIA